MSVLTPALYDFLSFSEEAHRVDVDVYFRGSCCWDLCEPGSQDGLDLDVFTGFEEETSAVSASEHCEGGWGGAEDGEAFDGWGVGGEVLGGSVGGVWGVG
jgi:hypothetical protein